MKKYILLTCLTLLTGLCQAQIPQSQILPEPGEWQKPGMGIMLYNDRSVRMDFESGANYIEAEGQWTVEHEGKYADTVKLTMTVVAWIGGSKDRRIDLTPRAPAKFVAYLIKTPNGVQSVNSVYITSGTRMINLNILALQRGRASATRPNGNG